MLDETICLPGQGDDKISLKSLFEDPGCISNIVCVFHHGRSGSFLLSSMFDDHPNILCAPPQSLMYFCETYHKFLSDIRRRGNARDRIVQSIVDFVIKEFPDLFCDMASPQKEFYKVGESPKYYPGVHSDDFSKILKSGLTEMIKCHPVSVLNVFKAIHVAFCLASGRKIIARKPIIVWSAHEPGHERKNFIVIHLAPVRFITAIRLPEKSLDSHMGSHFLDLAIKYGLEARPPRSLRRFVTDDSRFNGLDETDEIAVRFEDIHNKTERTMRALAKWCDIPWHSSLLLSTCGGKLFWFRARGEYQNGTRKLPKSDYKTRIIGKLDCLVIRYYMKENYVEWGYRKSSSGRISSWLQKVFVERIIMHIPSRPFLIVAWRYIKLCRNADKEWKDVLRTSRERRDRKGTNLIRLLPVE